MPLHTETINIDISLPDASEFASSHIVFTLTKPDADVTGNYALPPHAVAHDLDSNGEAGVGLWPNDRGYTGSKYDVHVFGVLAGEKEVAKHYLGQIQPLNGGGPFSLAERLAAGGASVDPAYYMVITQAEYDAAITAAATAQMWAEAAENFALGQPTASTTYYVRTDGNDANSGLTDSAGGAFRTITRARDVAFGKLHLNGYNVAVQVGPGTYTLENLYTESPHVGPGRISFIGDPANPSNCKINAGGGNCLQAYSGAVLRFDGFELIHSGSNTRGGYTAFGGLIVIDNIKFSGTGMGIRASGGYVWAPDATLEIASNMASFINVHDGGVVDIVGATITLTGTPVFTDGFMISDDGGAINIHSNTYVGTGLGKKYLKRGGTIFIGDDVLPVPSAGIDIPHRINNTGSNPLPIHAGQAFSLGPDQAVSLDISDWDHMITVAIHSLSGAAASVPNGRVRVRQPGLYCVPLDTFAAPIDFAASGGPLTGTTGTAGRFRMVPHTDGRLYFENRSASTYSFIFEVSAPPGG